MRNEERTAEDGRTRGRQTTFCLLQQLLEPDARTLAAVQQTQLPASRSRSYLPPCLVARAGRKHLPVVTPKSHTRRSVTKVPTFGPRKSVRSTGPVGGVLGALVVNLTCEVRRVAKLPSEPRGDAYQIRQAKYVDSSHPNTRTSQGALGQGVAALQIHLCKGIVKSYRTPALHGLAPFPRTSNPKRHKNV